MLMFRFSGKEIHRNLKGYIDVIFIFKTIIPAMSIWFYKIY